MADDAFDRPIGLTAPDGTRLAAYDLGGTGPDVLFVHATGFCAGVWGPLASRLGGGVRATAVDVRGHGRSQPPAAGMDWEAAAADVLAAVDALGLERPVGAGHSMGGALLLLAEAARPGTFAGLWLFEPIVLDVDRPVPVPPDGTDSPMVRAALRRRDSFPSAQDALVNFASKPPLDQLHPEALEAYVRHGFEELADGSVALRCRPEVEADTFRNGGRHGAARRLGAVTCPTVVLRGDDGPPGPARVAASVAGALPAGRLEAHPELGHFGPLEDPDAMAASLAGAVRAAVGGPA